MSTATTNNDPYMAMRVIRVIYADSTVKGINVNGTRKDITDYFVGHRFDLGDPFDPERERMVRAVAVVFVEDSLHYVAGGAGYILYSGNQALWETVTAADMVAFLKKARLTAEFRRSSIAVII